MLNGKVVEILSRVSSGFEPLTPKEEKPFLRLITKYKKDIVKKWVAYFILRKNVKIKDIGTKFLP